MSSEALNRAMTAKGKLAAMLKDVPEVVAIGIAILDGGFGLKVNLVRATNRAIPQEVDGLPVVIATTGEIAPLSDHTKAKA